MFKLIEALLIKERICSHLDEEITGLKGVTYKMVVHFICSLPNPTGSKVHSNFEVLRDYNGNLPYYFNHFVVLYISYQNTFTTRHSQKHNINNLQNFQNGQS